MGPSLDTPSHFIEKPDSSQNSQRQETTLGQTGTRAAFSCPPPNKALPVMTNRCSQGLIGETGLESALFPDSSPRFLDSQFPRLTLGENAGVVVQQTRPLRACPPETSPNPARTARASRKKISNRDYRDTEMEGLWNPGPSRVTVSE